MPDEKIAASKSSQLGQQVEKQGHEANDGAVIGGNSSGQRGTLLKAVCLPSA
jgi:3-hydroxyisobutyrate dehydrogenase-like beta-hydroxyacid dehydrogenase